MNSTTISMHATEGRGHPRHRSTTWRRNRREENQLDKRVDIWAFGLRGLRNAHWWRPFARDTVSDTIAAILEREPQWEVLSPTLPVGLRRLLRRCLEKNTRHRLRDIGDARIEIEEAMATQRRPP